MERKAVSGTTFILLLLTLSIAITIRNPVSAFPQPTISVRNPQTGTNDFIFYTNTTTAGSRFNVTVDINEGTDVISWQVYMTYNATVLNATGAWVPSTDPEYIFSGLSTFTPPPDFDPRGAVLVGDITLPSVSVNFTTPKILAIIEFEILVEPPKGTGNKVSSPLAINNVDTFIMDSDVNRISPVEKIDGLYKYNWVAIFSQLEVKPKEYITQKLETFNIEIWLNKVDAGQRLIAAQFWLHYNATLLNVTKVTEGPFLAQFKNAQTEPYTFFISEIENQTVKVAVLIMPNATSEGGKYNVFPQGNGTLATITFQGIYQDIKENNCTLELTNIILLSDSLRDIDTLPPINGFYKILPESHDVVTTNVTTSVTEAYVGWIVEIKVTVANHGDFAETFNVTAHYNSTPIETQTVVNLAPSDNVTLAFSWNTLGSTLGNYVIKAEASIVLGEENIENNVFIDGVIKIKMVGDVNGDSKIDIRDITTAALAFGSYPEHPKWNPQADINQDGKVDIRDLVLIAKNFGKTYP